MLQFLTSNNPYSQYMKTNFIEFPNISNDELLSHTIIRMNLASKYTNIHS